MADGGFAKNIPNNLTEMVRYIVSVMFRRTYRMQGKVKKIVETGTRAGKIYVFCEKITPFGIESKQESWLPAFPGASMFRHMPPDVGDIVDIAFGGPDSDVLYYLGHSPASYKPVKTGTGIKSIFEYKVGGDVFSIFFDKTKKKFTIQAGDELFEVSTDGINWTASKGSASTAKFGGDVIINNDTAPTSLGKHKHVSSAPGTPDSPMLPGL